MKADEDHCKDCCQNREEVAVLKAESMVLEAQLRKRLEDLMAEGADITPLLDQLGEDGHDVQALLFG